MRAYANLPIQSKLQLIVAVTVAVALLPACAAILIYDRVQTREAIRGDLATLAEIVSTNSAAALSFEDAKSAKEILAGLGADHSIDAAALYLPSRTLLAKHVRSGASPLLLPWAEQDGSRLDRGRLILFHRIEYRGQTIGKRTTNNRGPSLPIVWHTVRLHEGAAPSVYGLWPQPNY